MKRVAGAYHEAGHAVIGHCCGGESGVWLSPDGEGRTFFRKSTGLEPRATAKLGMGGPAAEYIFMNPTAKEFSLVDCNASEQDLEDINRAYGVFREIGETSSVRKTGSLPARRCGPSGTAFDEWLKNSFSTIMPSSMPLTSTR